MPPALKALLCQALGVAGTLALARAGLIGGLIALSLVLPVSGLVLLKMLPFDNKSEFQVVVDMPAGTPLEATAATLQDLGAYLATVPEVRHYQIYAGTAAPINFNGLVRQYYLRNAHEMGDIQVNLVDKSHRSDQSHVIASRVRGPLQDIGRRHGANVKVVEVPPGPPVMAPIVAEIYGPSAEGRRAFAQSVRQVFERTPGVVDVDDSAIAALTAFYGRVLRPGNNVLDLMSSWVSHLPEGVALGEVIGHGMNAQELAANPRLTRSFVQDLNREPALPIDDASLDAALCCVSVQYLRRPVEVFAEVRRSLRPGAPFIVSYSNRCFPTKAVAIWRSLDLGRHAALIRLYFDRAGFSEVAVHGLANGAFGDPLVAVVGRA